MLDDTPRKLLRIIYQFQWNVKRMPDLVELTRLSGRYPEQIKQGMKVLAEQNYIMWNHASPVETASIIEGWERDAPFDMQSQQGSESAKEQNNLDYWMYH